jgi:hypothetical protein
LSLILGFAAYLDLSFILAFKLGLALSCPGVQSCHKIYQSGFFLPWPSKFINRAFFIPWRSKLPQNISIGLFSALAIKIYQSGLFSALAIKTYHSGLFSALAIKTYHSDLFSALAIKIYQSGLFFHALALKAATKYINQVFSCLGHQNLSIGRSKPPILKYNTKKRMH